MGKKIEESVLEDSQSGNFSNLLKSLNKIDGHAGAKLVKDVGLPPFWLSTGDDIFDIIISNRKYGGIAGGRITLLNGLQSCVTLDAIVNIIVDGSPLTTLIRNINELLLKKSTVLIETINDEYTKVTSYSKLGKSTTLLVELENNRSIKVSLDHLFYSDNGWIRAKDVKTGVSLRCSGSKPFSKVKEITIIGIFLIVSITVLHPLECYYANGILNHNSGKSLVCAHLVKSCQEQGGIPFYIDTLAAISWQFMQAIGVDILKIIYYDSLNTVLKIYKAVLELMYTVRLQMPDKPLLIIIDSLSAAVTLAQMQNKEYLNKGYLAAIKAKMNSLALAKLAPMVHIQNVALVITSQVRTDMDQANPYMDAYKSSSGGMALPFYASSQIRLTKKGKIKLKIHGVETIIGVRTKARIDKSRLGPAYRECEFDVYYMSGIDNYTNWLLTLKKYEIVKKGATSKNVIINYEGTLIKVPGTFQQTIKLNKLLRLKVYDILALLLILKYKEHDYTVLTDTTILYDNGEKDNI